MHSFKGYAERKRLPLRGGLAALAVGMGLVLPSMSVSALKAPPAEPTVPQLRMITEEKRQSQNLLTSDSFRRLINGSNTAADTTLQVNRNTQVEKDADVSVIPTEVDDVDTAAAEAYPTETQPSQAPSATVVRQEYAPYETVVKPSPLIPAGTRKMVQAGEQGIIDATVEQTLDNETGAVLSEKVIERMWSYLPRNEVTLFGANVPVSPLDFGVPLDDAGRPLAYSRVLQSQVATGYSARPGAKTASGMPAIVGHVAVDPRVIPYGSRLYITSADGSFVYGFAIAADTGTGLLQGVVDVDLFYETYTESALNGRKRVDIYIF